MDRDSFGGKGPKRQMFEIQRKPEHTEKAMLKALEEANPGFADAETLQQFNTAMELLSDDELSHMSSRQLAEMNEKFVAFYSEAHKPKPGEELHQRSFMMYVPRVKQEQDRRAEQRSHDERQATALKANLKAGTPKIMPNPLNVEPIRSATPIEKPEKGFFARLFGRE